MKVRVLTIGRPSLSYAKAGVEEYQKRLQHYVQFEWQALRVPKSHEESKTLLEKSVHCHRIVLDERGKSWSSKQWAEKMTQWELSGKPVAFLIGGSDGHSQELRAQADELVSLAHATMQHELALVVLLEQIYRACTIRRGEPYHRE